MKKIFFAMLVFTGCVFFNSCQKKLLCPDCDTNKPPIAMAKPNQTIVYPKDSVTLDGTSSYDPDGTIVKYKWAKIAGPVSSNIIQPDSSKTLVKTLVMGVYKFELTVTDNGALSAKDTVQITVNNPAINHPPVACAGPDQTITLPTNIVTLDGGCSTDPDNNITTYLWTKISGPSSFNIANANAVQTQVTNLVQGSYQFELKVTDAGGLFSKDTIAIMVVPPLVLCNMQLTPFGHLSMARENILVAGAGNKILFAGVDIPGTNGISIPQTRVDIYDRVTQAWSTAELSQARFGMAVTVLGNKIFFAGGYITSGTQPPYNIYGTSRVDVFDVATNTWSTAELSTPRGDIGTGIIGNKIYFAGGGLDPYFDRSNKMDIYDASTNTWSTGLLTGDRIVSSAISINSQIYFAGGEDGNAILNKVDIYNGSSWSTITMDEPKTAMASISAGNTIFWAGGITSYNGNNSIYSDKVEMYDVTNGNHTSHQLVQARSYFYAVKKNNKILFYTGTTQSGSSTNVDIYDTNTQTWSACQIPQSIVGTGNIFSVGDKIYLAGGQINGVLSNQVWLLDF
ncbi:MAG: hypothetical protein M3004_03205 [Bacteroidota bacterium]|nr:hypothetical protein [Bacteroidota bacterium]